MDELTKRTEVNVNIDGIEMRVRMVTYDGNWEEFETEGIFIDDSERDITRLIDATMVYDRVVEAAMEGVYEPVH